jgi:hypothetical protein
VPRSGARTKPASNTQSATPVTRHAENCTPELPGAGAFTSGVVQARVALDSQYSIFSCGGPARRNSRSACENSLAMALAMAMAQAMTDSTKRCSYGHRIDPDMCEKSDYSQSPLTRTA